MQQEKNVLIIDGEVDFHDPKVQSSIAKDVQRFLHNNLNKKN